MDGRAIYDYQIGSLEGRLLTLVEGLGLRESQENAAKDMLKSILRTALYIDTTYVYGNYLNEAIKKSREDQDNGAGVTSGGTWTSTSISGTNQ